jgi:biopolymer transport protein ExbD
VDITPLIDVVFLMLIFFMVSTTFDKQTQLKVDLPKAETSAIEEAPPEKITITIDAEGQYYVNDRELVKHDAETLRRTLEKIADGRAELPIVVSGDRSAPLQSMMTVLDVAAQLGMARLSFIARQAETETD